MNLIELIEHPELLDKDTLYQLRQLTASHPYYQTARLLLLQNLYLLHESSFDDELQRAALYITDRTKLFDMVEARHYQLTSDKSDEKKTSAASDRTTTLIDNFLGHDTKEPPRQPKRRRPTATDATVDYVAYLLESGEDSDTSDNPAPEMEGQSLIDKFINEEGGKMTLQEKPEYAAPFNAEEQKSGEEGYFTATLARIYVKQGRYSKALEIIKRLNLNYPKKSAYFADQIRFLEKLIINNKK
ncbi:MAG: tetratricopeptide repeat protein [Prevotella sp.]|nr:tetratricopeptide repeat protein [Prevotella sp.]